MSINWETYHEMSRNKLGDLTVVEPMTARKRSNTAVREPEEDESTRKRLKNIWKSGKKAETLEEAIEEIAFLKSHLKTALEFIDKTRTAIDAPASLKSLMNSRPGGAKALAQSIRAEMNNVHEPLEEDVWEPRKTGITSDHLSQAMVPFISSIRELAEVDDENSLEEAYELMFHLKSLSYAGEEGGGYGDRDSDEPADELLRDLITKRVEAGHVWKWTDDSEDLEREAKDRASFGIEPWFPKSREWLGALPKQAKEPKPAPINSLALTDANLAALGYGGRDIIEILD